MWRKSRADGGKSQAYMAEKMGVSRKTVQNWEDGLSCPSQERAFEWFKVLDLHPLPYYLDLLYPEINSLKPASADADVKRALVEMIQDLSPDACRKLLYWMYGEHGSSPIAVLEMITAHLQTPLQNRLNIAQSIETNYEVAKAGNRLVQPDHVQPDLDLLKKAIKLGKESALNGRKTYSVFTADSQKEKGN